MHETPRSLRIVVLLLALVVGVFVAGPAAAESLCIDLNTGWNLVSWHVDTENDDVESITAGIADCIDVVLGFEVGSATYDPSLPQFSTLDNLDHFHGYWFRMNCPAQLCLTGDPVDQQTPIGLETNWNLVSYLPGGAFATEEALNSVITDLIVALGYDDGGLSYETLHPELANLLELSPNHGYWLKVMDDASLIYPGAPAKLTGYVSSVQTMSARPVASGVLPTPEWVDLYGDGITLDGELLPVGSKLEFRDERGNLCGACELEVAGLVPFVPVYLDDRSTDIDEGADRGSRLSLSVDGSRVAEEFNWTTFGDRIRIEKLTRAAGAEVTLPASFSLGQNYPNPFNPSTVIKFSVPTTAEVRLDVFNILGVRVKTLIDQHLSAGSYQAIWDGTLADGSRAPSAIYFYRLTAGDFTESRKMLLVK